MYCLAAQGGVEVKAWYSKVRLASVKAWYGLDLQCEGLVNCSEVLKGEG